MNSRLYVSDGHYVPIIKVIKSFSIENYSKEDKEVYL